MAFYDFDASESNWQDYSATFERNERLREERDLSDWQEQDFPVRQVREEAADSMLPILCDGSGVVEEEYIDVDQTRVIPCKGCPACDEELVEFAAPQRKPARREMGDPAEKVA